MPDRVRRGQGGLGPLHFDVAGWANRRLQIVDRSSDLVHHGSYNSSARVLVVPIVDGYEVAPFRRAGDGSGVGLIV